MTEGAFNRKLKAALEAHFPQSVVLKHNDRSTKGIPDFSVSNRAMTLWIECKMEPEMPTKLQAHYLKKFGQGSALVCASMDGRNVAFQAPYYHGPVKFISFEKLVNEIKDWFHV